MTKEQPGDKIKRSTNRDEESEPRASAPRVLLMADDEIIRDLAGEMLIHMGYDVELAVAGGEAVERYRGAGKAGNPFAAVILDLTIRGAWRAMETIKALIRIDPAVKAILSSGSRHDPLVSNFKRYGFSELLLKPYRIRELGEALERVLTARSG